MDRSTAKRFEGLTDAHEWLAAHFTSWAESLTEPEREAVTAYKGKAFQDINETLRFGDLEDDAYVEEVVQDLDLALARMRLPEPVITWRGFESFDLSEAIADPAGDVISDAAFLSTSLVREVAERFLTSDPEYPSLLAEVAIPGGASVGALVGAPDMVDERAEAEILLPRNTELSITATQPGAVPIIQMEVIT